LRKEYTKHAGFVLRSGEIETEREHKKRQQVEQDEGEIEMARGKLQRVFEDIRLIWGNN
jgi:hypothetical protein